MKFAIAASLVATATAFSPAAPQARSSSSSSLAASPFEGDIGAPAPLGVFDPLGLVDGGDQEYFDRLRYVELKHGRIAMMAVVGYLTTLSGARFPGLISYDGTKFSDLPSGIESFRQMPVAGFAQILLFVFVLEVGMATVVESGVGEFPGDFTSVIDFGWGKYDEKTKLRKRGIELANGRAAMMGILGLCVHEQLGNLGDIIPGLN